MKAEQLKTGFWGYKKFSVYQYITALEEEFSAKLLETERESQAALAQERQRCQQLEEQLSQLRKQYEAQRSEQLLIANTLLEAQRYAEQLKKETDQREEQIRLQLEQTLARRDGELEEYAQQLQRLRENFCAMLQEMDGAAQQLEEQLEQIRPAELEQNLTLFQREPEPVA